jgi:hypothetical protein
MPPRAQTTKKKTGSAGKRYPLNMRTTFELRRKLEEAAKRSGMSLAQETERRVENSFTLSNDPRFAKFFAVLSGAFNMFDADQSGDRSDRDAQYRLLTLALATVLNNVAADFYSVSLTVGDANEGPSKTYSEFANQIVKSMHEERERLGVKK